MAGLRCCSSHSAYPVVSEWGLRERFVLTKERIKEVKIEIAQQKLHAVFGWSSVKGRTVLPRLRGTSLVDPSLLHACGRPRSASPYFHSLLPLEFTRTTRPLPPPLVISHVRDTPAQLGRVNNKPPLSELAFVRDD